MSCHAGGGDGGTHTRQRETEAPNETRSCSGYRSSNVRRSPCVFPTREVPNENHREPVVVVVVSVVVCVHFLLVSRANASVTLAGSTTGGCILVSGSLALAPGTIEYSLSTFLAVRPFLLQAARHGLANILSAWRRRQALHNVREPMGATSMVEPNRAAPGSLLRAC